MKRFFLAAALAIVAVGGALTANATNYYALGSSVAKDCEPTGTQSCSVAIGSDNAYLIPASEGDQGDPQDVSDLFKH
jgi:hypothetical protein